MKKLLSILLVLVLCTSLMAMTASAEGGYAMKLSSHELTKGTATVDVEVTLTANDGLGAVVITPKYDTSVLKLTSIKGEGLPGSWTVGTSAVWYNTDGSTFTGKILTFSFEVLKDGSTDVTLECEATTVDYVEPTVAVTKGFVCTAHDDTEEQTTPATCTEAGKVDTVCKHCGKVIKTQAISATGHSWDEGAVTTAPTCTEKGVKTFTCTRGCGETKTEEIAATGHTEDAGTVAADVSCGETADITYKCEVCGEVTRVVTGAVVQHAWDEGAVTTEPTCTAKGVKTFTCTRGCGETKTEEVAALGHKWAEEGTVKTPPTCYADGVMSYACDNGCGETKEVAIKERPDHTPPAVDEWEIGKVNHKYTCVVEGCGAEVTTKHECHDWTQNEKGEWIGTCTVCGQEVNKGDLIPAGDITPILVMGGVAVFCLLAAAAYVTYRKVAR